MLHHEISSNLGLLTPRICWPCSSRTNHRIAGSMIWDSLLYYTLFHCNLVPCRFTLLGLPADEYLDYGVLLRNIPLASSPAVFTSTAYYYVSSDHPTARASSTLSFSNQRESVKVTKPLLRKPQAAVGRMQRTALAYQYISHFYQETHGGHY